MTVMMWIRAILLLLALVLIVWARVDNLRTGWTSGDADLANALGEGFLVAAAILLSMLALGSWLVQLVWRAIFG